MKQKKGLRYQKIIALRLEEELTAIVAKMAEQEDRPISSMCRVLVREALIARGKISTAGNKRKN